MHPLPKYERLIAAGMTSSGLVLLAGVIASFGRLGIAIAAGVLTVAVMVAIAGVPYAKDRRVGTGLMVLMAAVLPLFAAFYAAGLAVLKSLGQAAASLLLIGVALALGAATLVVSRQWRRRAPR